jgi:hypothetical protein
VTKELKLIKYIESQIGLPFKYGKNDCTLFIAGAIDAMHGTNLHEKYTGLWHDKKSAWKYAKKHGGITKTLLELSYKKISGIAYIQTGDLLVNEQLSDKSYHSIAIFTSSKIAQCTDTIGVELVSLNKLNANVEVFRCLE